MPRKKKGPIMPRAGKTVAGFDYLTTHSCPMCDAMMETIGAGYPQIVCSRCRMPMVAKPKKVGN